MLNKNIKIYADDKIRCVLGTVDHNKNKSLFLNIKTWVKSKKEMDDFNRLIYKKRNSIKVMLSSLINIKHFDNENFIVSLTLKNSGLKRKNFSFMELDINLYKKNTLPISNNEIIININEIIKKLRSDIITDSDLLEYNSTKKIT